MFSIAITGGIACGKSQVARILLEKGCAVWDADVAARRLMAQDGAVYEAVITAFGDGIVDARGFIDRHKLAEQVFFDSAKRECLNSIVHPLVFEMLASWLQKNAEKRVKCAAVELPLLYECGRQAEWNKTLCVFSARHIQLRRLISRGVDEVLANGMIDSQLALTEKMRLADVVLINNGAIEGLRQQVLHWFDKLANKEGSHGDKNTR